MILESIGIYFLSLHSNVTHPKLFTSECNEHTFGGWRQIEREFIVQQAIGIEEKCRVKMNAVYESGLTLVWDK